MRIRRRSPAELPDPMPPDPMPPVAATVTGATDAGPRAENQDRWAAGPGWAVVCDGVGGHRGGAHAATTALDAVVAVLDGADPGRGTGTGDRLVRAAEAANAAVVAGRAADPAVGDMATTLVVAAHDATAPPPDGGGERWVVLQVGDSPAWHVTADDARSVTWDHSLVGDLVRAGALTPAEARAHPSRHVVTRAIGITPEVDPELFVVDLGPGELLVLCSDGLSDVAGPEVVATVADRNPDDVAAGLVAEALARGTRDNVTVVVVGRPGPAVPG